MKRKHFTEDELDVLLSPATWRIVTSFLEPEERTVRHEKHAQWMRSNQQTHKSTEIMLSLSGSSRFGYMGLTYPCRPGSLFLINPFEQHDYMYPPFHPDSRCLWIGISDTSAFATVFRIEGRHVSTPYRTVLYNTPFLQLFLGELSALGSGAVKLTERVRRASLLSLLSMLISELVRGSIAGSEPETREFHKGIINVVAQNIQSAGGKGFRLENTAKFAGFSRFHFHRLFRKETGLTFHEYVDRCRIRKMQELRKSGMNKSQIADELGFSSLSVFSRWMNPRKRQLSI